MVSLESIAARDEARAAQVAALAAGGRAPAWLGDVRRAAWERFAALGFPTTREEAWRHTDVGPIARAAFALAPPATVAAAQVDGIALQEVSGPRLVFVNGRWAPERSRLEGLPAGIRIVAFSAALGSAAGAVVERHLGRCAGPDGAGFTALNTACFEDGVLVHLGRGSVLAAPLQLLFLAVPAAGDPAPFEVHPRVLVVAEEGSQASVIEIHAGTGNYFSNPVTEIAVGPAAVVTHTCVQRQSLAAYHVGRLHAHLERDARFTSHALALGAALARTELEVVLAGEGAECALHGLYAAGGTQHTDNRTDVTHAQPHGTSNQLYKGVLGGQAHGVFNGKVLVAAGAQKTDAHQTNRNLLLSDGALADTNPQLEIYADDVRCTHGATIGRLDETAVFYLRSRGIGEDAARDILTHAFARDAVAGVQPPELRAALEGWIAERLGEIAASGEATP